MEGIAYAASKHFAVPCLARVARSSSQVGSCPRRFARGAKSVKRFARFHAHRLVFAMRLAKRFAILKHEKGGLSPASSLYAERRD
jgi:hypothetical protein